MTMLGAITMQGKPMHKAVVLAFPTTKMGLDLIGREICRVAVMLASRRANRRSDGTMAPTEERFRHGQTIQQYDGAVDQAGEMGHLVTDACLLDKLRDGGLLGKGETALLRHSAGIWLKSLFHDSGLMRSVTALITSTGGANPGGERPAPYEASTSASNSLAMYLAVLRAMDTRVLPGDAKNRVNGALRRRYCHAVREIACWDRWPATYSKLEVQRAFDRLAEMDGLEIGGE
jgi:hypothetical protein